MTIPQPLYTAEKTNTLRNQSMECCKLIASFFVIFLHVPFPGDLGRVVSCLARFAVPVFFGISGYFSYQADSARLVRRMHHILQLNLAAISVSLLWGCMTAVYSGENVWNYLYDSIPTASELGNWLIFSINPFAGHLWYLTAIGVCYAVLWGYVRCFGDKPVRYRPLYRICAPLLVLHFALSEFAMAIGFDIPYPVSRNAFLMGLPMFSMGIFLREYRQRIMEALQLNNGKLILAILTGTLLALLERFCFGPSEMHIGTVLTVMALILLMAANPRVTASSGWAEAAISRFGFLSTAIYILHMVVLEAYTLFFRHRAAAFLGAAEPFAEPLMICLLSLLAAIFCERCLHFVKRLRRRKSF